MSGYRAAQPPGFEKTPDLRTWESAEPCPRCAFELFCGEKDGIEVSACGACGGVWLRTEQAKRALAIQSRIPEELARKVERVTRARPWKKTSALACPECKAPMRRSIIGQVIVDLCGHGTWFDRTELATVMRHVRGEPDPVSGVDQVYMREQSEGAKWAALASLVTFFQDLLSKEPPGRP